MKKIHDLSQTFKPQTGAWDFHKNKDQAEEKEYWASNFQIIEYIIHNKVHTFSFSFSPAPTTKADKVEKYFLERPWMGPFYEL